MKNEKKKKDQIVQEAENMYNDMEGLEPGGPAESDIAADEDMDFEGGEISDLDNLDELEDEVDVGLEDALQTAQDGIQAAADAAGVELEPGEEELEGELEGEFDEEMGEEMGEEGMEDMVAPQAMGGEEDDLSVYESVMEDILNEETPAWAKSKKSQKEMPAKNKGNYDKQGKTSPARSHNGENEGIPGKGDVGARRNKPEQQAQDGVDGTPTDDDVVEPSKLDVGDKKISPAKSHNGENETISQKKDHGANRNVGVPAPTDDGFDPDIEVNTEPTGGKETAVGGPPVNKGSFGTGNMAGFVNQDMVNLAASHDPEDAFNKKADAIFEKTMKKYFSKKK